jgi:hypothetical protein
MAKLAARSARRGGSLRPHTVLILLVMCTVACGQEVAPGSRGSATQQRAIEVAIRADPAWRLATASDHVGNPEEVSRLRASQPSHDPYFASSSPDTSEGAFAVVLVRDTVFRVLYFPYSDSGYGPPVEVAQAGWFREAYLTLLGDTLRVAAYRSDVILDFVWNASARRFELLRDSSDTGP